MNFSGCRIAMQQRGLVGHDRLESGSGPSISIILLSVWLVGIATRSTLNGYLHILAALVSGSYGLRLATGPGLRD